MQNEFFTVHREDEHFLIVEKPAALHTAPLRETDTDNLLYQLMKCYPELAAVPGKKPVEPGLLHRLDYETSGLVLVARTEIAFRNLSTQFAGNQVIKNYYAVSLFSAEQCRDSPHHLSLSDWQHICRAGFASSPAEVFIFQSRFKPWGPGRKQVKVVTDNGQGKKTDHLTQTVYTSEIRFLDRRDEMLLVQVKLTKGFRHQIRAHLAFLGLPILGDPLYLKPVASRRPPATAGRMYLHAAGLKFRHPLTGETIDFQTPVPEEFEKLFKPG